MRTMHPFAPTHASHKLVEAHPITAAEFQADGTGKVAYRHPETGETVVVLVPAGFRRMPGSVSEGDMLVRYAPTAQEPDGYLSHSPRQVFEDGYRRLTWDGAPDAARPETKRTASFDFGAALRALKAGHRVCRAGWNGKGMWLSLSGALDGRLVAADKFWSPHNETYARQNGGGAVVLPCITMKTADGSILMGWLASQTDMLAGDWQIVPAAETAQAA